MFRKIVNNSVTPSSIYSLLQIEGYKKIQLQTGSPANAKPKNLMYDLGYGNNLKRNHVFKNRSCIFKKSDQLLHAHLQSKIKKIYERN